MTGFSFSDRADYVKSRLSFVPILIITTTTGDFVWLPLEKHGCHKHG